MFMNIRISGKTIANKIKEELKKKISVLDKDKEIIFSIIYVGHDPVIDNFIRYKQKFGEEIGVLVKVYRFDENVSQEELLGSINNISQKSDAMIVQLPLPKHLDTQTIIDAVPAYQDVDVLGTHALQNFSSGDSDFFPPVTGAMVEVLRNQNYDVTDKNIVIFGNGNLVGKPFGLWLSRQGISYSVIDKNTDAKTRKRLLRNADCIIAGAGVPHVISVDDIKEGVVLLDGGTSEAGKKLRGDVHPDCYEKALFYTPVPGGIGPITIAVLYQNILKTQKMK